MTAVDAAVANIVAIALLAGAAAAGMFVNRLLERTEGEVRRAD